MEVPFRFIKIDSAWSPFQYYMDVIKPTGFRVANLFWV
jgi:hypothetical protein